MAYYNPCPACGANLDPCEQCECVDAQQRQLRGLRKRSAAAWREEEFKEEIRNGEHGNKDYTENGLHQYEL